jgi:hypothetical protein
MRKVRRLTPSLLRKMVLQEKTKLGEVLEVGSDDSEAVAAKVEEVPADEQADTLALDIDYVKALKIKEASLKKRLKKIAEVKKHLRAKIIKKL